MISKVFGVEPFIQTAIIYEIKPFDVNRLIIIKQGQFFTRFSFLSELPKCDLYNAHLISRQARLVHGITFS